MPLADEVLRSILLPAAPAWRSSPGLKHAAVLAPWFTRQGADHLLFTLRRRDLPVHAGEISFPGGAREGDENPLACALRECSEEVGLDPGAVTVLGQLEERTSIGGFLVHPFVGRIPEPGALRPDPSEVEEILEIPVADLQDPERWTWLERPVPEGGVRRSPCFPVNGHVLWGLTARFTMDLLERIPR